MSNLSYRTRGNSSPQGRERVYFTCHPADFKTYFGPICEDIFQTQNCAIWYRTEMEEKDAEKKINEEELALDLGQMQLFVIPITSRFLYKPNSARNVEFKFAIDHHIPVLPLMQESGLEEDFNRICGDMQYLDRQASDSDPTTLPYEEKLKTFLNSVLLGDDLAAKVRAAFDAYIFLSYRKKDRKYAQELMRLIHKNPFCRDIAIWYDEFLTPGENFNDAIRAAMEKSSLFAMVVTPNLVNEENYVMTTEYPKATEAGMPILPAQMVETDREALAQAYPGIGRDHVTDAHDESALREALAGALSDGSIIDTFMESDGIVSKNLSEAASKRLYRITLTETDRKEDPQHLFFIGLAYLSGIDVELDGERAVGLITRAAEAGLEEAIEKLVSMYRGGDGVQRDYDVAIQWQEKLVELCRDAYENDKGEKAGQRYTVALGKLGEYIWERRDEDRAREIYITTGKLILEMMKLYDKRIYRRNLAVVFERLGDVILAGKYIEAAKKSYSEALQIRQILAEETGTEKSCRELCISLLKMGNVCQAEGNLAGAKKYFEAALQMEREIREQTGSERNLQEQVVFYIRLGNIYYEEGKLEEAREYYKKGLYISGKLAEQFGTAEEYHSLMAIYDSIGDIYRDEGNYEKAREYYEKSIRISRETAKNDTIDSRRDLSVSCEKLGSISMAEGNLDKACQYYEEAMLISEKLARETRVTENYLDLSLSCEKMGELYRAKGNLEKAKEYFTRSMLIASVLEEDMEAVEVRDRLSVSCFKMGDIYEAEGDIEAAFEYYERFRQISEILVKETGTVESRRKLSASYDRLGDIYRIKGKTEEALKYYEAGLKLNEQLAEETGMIECRRSLSISYENIGNICLAEGDLRKGREYHERAFRIRRELANETGTIESRRDLSISYDRLGDIFQEEGDLGMACIHYLSGLHICEELEKETGTVESRCDLSVSYEKLGYVCELAGDSRKAREYYEAGLKISEKLSEETESVEIQRSLGVFYSRLAVICADENKPGEARKYHEADLRVSEKLAQMTGTAVAYDDLACAYYSFATMDGTNPDRELLKNALHIWQELAAQCPGVSRYRDSFEMVKVMLLRSRS